MLIKWLEIVLCGCRMLYGTDFSSVLVDVCEVWGIGIVTVTVGL